MAETPGPFLFQTWIVSGTATGTSVVSATAIVQDQSLRGTATGTSVVRAAVSHNFVSAPPARVGIARLTGGAVLEIRLWDGSAGAPAWVDVTCDVISARASWGASRSRGVLSQGDGGGLDLSLSDPDRLLDPTNTAGPFYGFLKPGLWLRFSYDDGTRTVLKMARADSIVHVASSAEGQIRATDWVSFLAWYPWPNVANPYGQANAYPTLHAFAAGNIAALFASKPVPAYYLPVTVEPEPSPGIPIAVPNPTGGSVWSLIAKAARTALQFPWIDADAVLRFRDATQAATAAPPIYVGLRGPMPLDFAGNIEDGNVFNYVKAKDSVGAESYGFRAESVFLYGERLTEAGFNLAAKPPGLFTPAEWIDTVLYHHESPMLEAVPLAIWPANAPELRELVGMRPMDRVVIELDEVDPVVAINARAIGAAVSVSPEGWSVEMVTWIARGDAQPQPLAVPGAPVLNLASPGNALVNLFWSAPVSDGGSPIIDYTVTVSPGGATYVSTGTSYTVPGLTNGTLYTFTVKARNAIGTGPASNALTATPAAAVYVERIQARGAGGGTAATTGNFTHGAAFTATMDGFITHIATYHYAPASHTAGQLHPLSIWSNAGVKLAHVDFVCPGNGLFADLDRPMPKDDRSEPRSTAWYEIALPTKLAIVAGQTYRVTCSAPAYTYFSVGAPASLAPHLTVYQSGFYIAGQDQFPTTAQPANYYPIDVVAEFSY